MWCFSGPTGRANSKRRSRLFLIDLTPKQHGRLSSGLHQQESSQLAASRRTVKRTTKWRKTETKAIKRTRHRYVEASVKVVKVERIRERWTQRS